MKKAIVIGLIMLIASPVFAGDVREVRFSQDLSAAPVYVTTSGVQDERLSCVMIHSSAAISEDLSITFLSRGGSAYDTVLNATTLTSDTDYVFRPNQNVMLEKGDEILVGVDNSGGSGTVGCVVKFEDVD